MARSPVRCMQTSGYRLCNAVGRTIVLRFAQKQPNSSSSAFFLSFFFLMIKTIFLGTSKSHTLGLSFVSQIFQSTF